MNPHLLCLVAHDGEESDELVRIYLAVSEIENIKSNMSLFRSTKCGAFSVRCDALMCHLIAVRCDVF